MRHDAVELKQSLTVDDIKLLLTELGASHNHYNENKDELITNTICHNVSEGSHKLYYKPTTHSFHCFTQCGCSFDIYELIKKVYELRGNEISFGNTIDYVANKTGKNTHQNVFGQGFLILDEPKINTELEWMQRFNRPKKVEMSEPTVYSEKILDVFSKGYYHPMFLNDNISKVSMDKFNIGFYERANRISIPHRHWKHGGIIGLRGRYVGDEEHTAKYMPLTIQGHTYSYHIMTSLYGYYECQKAIKKYRKIIIFESEKSVMQTFSYFGEDCYAVALSGSSLSQQQVDIILNTEGLTEVQIALDKEWQQGDEKAEIRQMEKVLRMGRKFSPYVKTTVLWDTEGVLGYKDSPSDVSKDVLLRLLEGKQEILNVE